LRLDIDDAAIAIVEARREETARQGLPVRETPPDTER